jgi:hypothetical protein
MVGSGQAVKKSAMLKTAIPKTNRFFFIMFSFMTRLFAPRVCCLCMQLCAYLHIRFVQRYSIGASS